MEQRKSSKTMAAASPADCVCSWSEPSSAAHNWSWTKHDKKGGNKICIFFFAFPSLFFRAANTQQQEGISVMSSLTKFLSSKHVLIISKNTIIHNIFISWEQHMYGYAFICIFGVEPNWTRPMCSYVTIACLKRQWKMSVCTPRKWTARMNMN